MAQQRVPAPGKPGKPRSALRTVRVQVHLPPNVVAFMNDLSDALQISPTSVISQAIVRMHHAEELLLHNGKPVNGKRSK